MTRQTLWGVLIGAVGVALSTAALLPFRHSSSRATPALVLVVPVVAAGIFGRRTAAVITAVLAAAIYSFSFVPPYDRVSISQPEDAAALVVFLVVAIVVGTLVALESSRREAAEQRAAEIRRLVTEREKLREEANRVELMTQLAAQRSALLRSVSHDLRTPLGTIQAVASDLRDGISYPAQTRDELLDLVVDEAARLDRIVANLLSLGRVETGSFQPDRQAVALDELIADRVRKLDRVLGGRRVELDLPADLPLVDADYSQLDQVITNLVENAARHTPAGAVLRVSACPNATMMEVAISDNGPGIPVEEQEAMFQPFHAGPGSTSTGVGLAICRAVIEAHGGHIRLDPSTPGTTVRFTVPLHG